MITSISTSKAFVGRDVLLVQSDEEDKKVAHRQVLFFFRPLYQIKRAQSAPFYLNPQTPLHF